MSMLKNTTLSLFLLDNGHDRLWLYSKSEQYQRQSPVAATAL
jgi:hypothetical protein